MTTNRKELSAGAFYVFNSTLYRRVMEEGDPALIGRKVCDTTKKVGAEVDVDTGRTSVEIFTIPSQEDLPGLLDAKHDQQHNPGPQTVAAILMVLGTFGVSGWCWESLLDHPVPTDGLATLLGALFFVLGISTWNASRE